MKLREIMTRPVLTVTVSEPASDAYARMRDAGVRHAIVTDDDGAIAGVVSERDLGGPDGGRLRIGRTVGDLARRDPMRAGPEASVEEGVRMVRTLRIGCIPIVDDGDLVGIVTRSDLLDALATRRRRRSSIVRATGDAARPPLVVSPNRDKIC
jgi:acetoin utilization protein AcuB